MEPRLALRRFSVSYTSFTLAPLSIEVVPGERIAVIGPNGSGKTTTLRAIAGRLHSYNGTILLDGVDLRTLLPLGRRKIGLLPEALAGYGWMSVRDHLDLLRQFYPEWDTEYAMQLAERLHVPLDQSIGALSKGSRVKVSFIAAESYRPPVLILDEPTSGLDPQVRIELIDSILEAADRESGRTILFSTHLLEDVEHIADRILMLVDGHLRLDSSVADLRDAHGGASLSKILYAALALPRDTA